MPIYIHFRAEVIYLSFAEVYADSFCFWELEAIFIDPFLYLVKGSFAFGFQV